VRTRRALFVAGRHRCSCFPFALAASSYFLHLSDPRMVPPSSYGSVPPLDAEAALAVTREAMAAQDGALEELSASVARVKQTALTMEAEVRVGNEELDALGGGVGRAADDVRRQASRVRASVRRDGWRQSEGLAMIVVVALLFCLQAWRLDDGCERGRGVRSTLLLVECLGRERCAVDWSGAL